MQIHARSTAILLVAMRQRVLTLLILICVGSGLCLAQAPRPKPASQNAPSSNDDLAVAASTLEAARQNDRAKIDTAFADGMALNHQTVLVKQAADLLLGSRDEKTIHGTLYLLSKVNDFILRGLPDADSERVIQVLSDLLDQEQFAENAARAIDGFGAKAKFAEAKLLGLLDARRPSVKMAALTALAWVAPDSPVYQQRLRRELNDPNEFVRASVLISLATSRAAPDTTIPIAITLLKHAEPQFRRVGVTVLGLYGPLAAEAIGPLVQVADEDADATIRTQAAGVLAQIDPAAAELIRGLMASLKGDQLEAVNSAEPRIRAGGVEAAATYALIHLLRESVEPRTKGLAVNVLARMGPPAKQAVPVLTGLLDDDKLKPLALLALVKIAPEALEEYVPKIAPAMEPGLPNDTRITVAAFLAKRGRDHSDRAVEVLSSMAQDKQNGRRFVAALGLANAAPSRAEPVLDVLIETLEDSDPRRLGDRDLAVNAVAQLKRRAVKAVPALLKTLDAPSPVLRGRAAWALGEIVAENQLVIPRLETALSSDESSDVRRFAAQSIGNFGPSARTALPTLTRALKRSDESDAVLAAIVNSIGNVGAHGVVADLAKLVNHSDKRVRDNVLYALNELGPEAREAVPELTKALATPYAYGVIGTLSRIGMEASPAIPALIKLLDGDSNPFTRRSAADTLARVYNGDPGAVEALVRGLKDPDPRVAATAAYSLGSIGEDARIAVDTLIAILNDPAQTSRSESLPEAVIYAIGRLGSASQNAVDSLVGLLTSKTVGVRRRSATALGDIGVSARRAVPALIQSLQDPDRGVRHNALISLGKIAVPDAVLIQMLIEKLRDDDRPIRISATIALGKQASAASATALLGDFKSAQTKIDEAIGARLMPGDIDSVVQAKSLVGDAIRRLSEPSSPERAWAWLIASPWRWGTLVYLLTVTTLCLGLLFVRPLWLLDLDRFLRDNTDLIRFAMKWFGKDLSTGVDLSSLTGLKFVRYHRRVLDAWVAARSEEVVRHFHSYLTVRERRLYVPSRIRRDDETATIDNPTVEHFRGAFGAAKFCVVFLGEGGTGKTSLALKAAHWGMEAEPGRRLRPHRMIPVLIEGDLDAAENPSERLLKTVRRKLQDVCELQEPVSDPLTRQLLSKQRILLIIDGFSELPDESKAAIGLIDVGFPANAVVITARRFRKAGQLVHHRIQIDSLVGADVQRFLERYLAEVDPDRFKPSEVAMESGRLLAAMGDRPLPALIVRFFADLLRTQRMQSQGISKIHGGYDVFRQNILARNRSAADHRFGDAQLVECLEFLAYECIKNGFRPCPIPVQSAETWAGNADLLKYLIDDLNILQKTGDNSIVSFVMDPVAEYLGAMHQVRLLGASEDTWKAFFGNLDQLRGTSREVRDFLVAVRDVCGYPEVTGDIPKFVSGEIASRLEEESAGRPQPVLERSPSALPGGDVRIAEASGTGPAA